MSGLRLLVPVVWALAIFVVPNPTPAQLIPGNTSEYGPQLGEPVVQRWRVGTVVRAEQGPVRGVTVSIPVPTDWPDQTVKIVEEDFSPHVANVGYRVIEGGVRQMLVTIPAVDPGQEARAALILEVTTYAVKPPADTSELTIPRNPPRDVRRYLGSSPFLNPRHRDVKRLAEELVGNGRGADEDEAAAEVTDWEKVELLYDWVRDNIEETNEALKGVENVIETKQGSAEDKVSLFVALCRAAKVPARIVWVSNHQYAEFFLTDVDGEGHWFPCQIVGDREFGGMSDVRPIMQRGDNFLVPEKKDPYRYVPELVKGTAGGGRPTVLFLRDLAPE